MGWDGFLDASTPLVNATLKTPGVAAGGAEASAVLAVNTA